MVEYREVSLLQPPTSSTVQNSTNNKDASGCCLLYILLEKHPTARIVEKEKTIRAEAPAGGLCSTVSWLLNVCLAG